MFFLFMHDGRDLSRRLLISSCLPCLLCLRTVRILINNGSKPLIGHICIPLLLVSASQKVHYLSIARHQLKALLIILDGRRQVTAVLG